MVISEMAETEYELDIGASLDKVMEALNVYVSVSVACMGRSSQYNTGLRRYSRACATVMGSVL